MTNTLVDGAPWKWNRGSPVEASYPKRQRKVLTAQASLPEVATAKVIPGEMDLVWMQGA